MSDKPRRNTELKRGLLTLWPGLAYLGLGFYFAWMLLLSDTCIWVSDIDASGNALTNAGLLVAVMLLQNITAAAALLLAAAINAPIARFLQSRWFTPIVSVLSVLGTVCIIGSGPYFIGGPFGLDIKGLFSYGAVICGLVAALLVLRCSLVLVDTPPHRVLVYCLISELFAVAMYFIIVANNGFKPFSGGPSYAGIIALALLPVLSSWATSLRITGSAPVQVNANLGDRLVGFGWFVVMLFVFSLAVGVSLGHCASNLSVYTLQAGTRISADFRLVLAIVFLALIIGRLERVPFPSVCLLSAAIVAVMLALLPLVGLDKTVAYVVVNVTATLFNIVAWCMLSLVASKEGRSPIRIFGLGFGAVMGGNGLGWFASVRIIPQLAEVGVDFAVYVTIALLTIILAAFVMNSKGFSVLFDTTAAQEFSLKAENGLKKLADASLPSEESAREAACEAIAREYGLSLRERDIFMLLAEGDSADAIAVKLFISANTVRTHVHNIYGKMDIHSKQELIDLVRSRTQR